ncbi:MAG TPA: tRNA epoxyqueuosine(34) reductase QueG [Acidimicrobiales bacterium]|nr:tRNA epoxyqueuosine(34) reductase QueG [Acidimicrobiales bacterium]
MPEVLASAQEPAELVAELRRRGQEAGLAAVGVAAATPMVSTRRILEERKAAGLAGGMQFTYRDPARSTDPVRILAGATSMVVGAWPYARSAGTAKGGGPGPVAPMGRVARYASRDHYADLRTALGQLADLLNRAGWKARVVADDNALVDRAAAERAGLGWFGKNSNILLPGQGSWFLLGSVVTNAPLPVDAPIADGCGACRRCLSSCPTGALVAPGVLDARKCLAWLLQATGVFPIEYRALLGDRIYGCDDCQDSCPANRLAAKRPSVDDGAPVAGVDRKKEVERQQAVDRQDEVDLLALLSEDGETLLAKYGRWYIPQRDPRYLRRNALIVLGNVADGRQPGVTATLMRYLDDPDELLRAHAVWAAARLGRCDLINCRPGLVTDPSPVVREEMARLSEVRPSPRPAPSSDQGRMRGPDDQFARTTNLPGRPNLLGRPICLDDPIAWTTETRCWQRDTDQA